MNDIWKNIVDIEYTSRPETKRTSGKGNISHVYKWKILMDSILGYRSNKKLNAYRISLNLKKFIDYTTEKSFINKIFSNFSQITNIPTKIISDDAKQILVSNFKFTPGKFSKRFSLKYIFLDSFIYLGLLILFIFFSKKNFEKKSYNIIVEDIELEVQLERFSKIANLLKNPVFICRKKIQFKKKNVRRYNIKFFPLLKFYHSGFLKGKKLNLFIFFLNLFYYSIKNKINLFFIFTKLFYKVVNYETIFSQVNSKVLLIDRFYKTSAIRNYVFKKHGGSITSCFQKNIFEFSISFYIYTDIIFCLGEGVPKICNRLGGKIKKFVPVGSLFLEHAWYNKKKDLSKIPSIAILIIGSNHLGASDRVYLDKHQHKNYYKFKLWIKKISNYFPKLSIIVKHADHHKVDEREKKILSNSSVSVVYKRNSINFSYGYVYKAKQIYAFVSTMILEGLSMGKRCYFVDPNFQNIAHLYNFKKTKNLRIKSFGQLKDTVIGNLKKSNKTKVKNTNYYCLKSNRVSEKVINFFKKNKYF